MTRAIVALAALLLAAAAPQPPIDDPEARISHDALGETVDTAVSGLTVRPGGPAWWQVTGNGRTVYILGAPWDVPLAQVWDKARLEARLKSADVLLVPPGYTEAKLPPGPFSLGPGIPERYRARLEAAAKITNQPADRYLKLSAVLAGYVLASDFRTRIGFESGGVMKTVQASARKQSLTEISMGSLAPQSRLVTASTASASAGLACLEAALAEVEAGYEPMRDAVDGWASGDVLQAINGPRAKDICTFAVPADAELRRQATRLQAEAIGNILLGRAALIAPASNPSSASAIRTKPDKAVAVIGLRSLIAEGGVLDQLKAKGFTIKPPSILADG